MGKACARPRTTKICAFCNYWTGDASLKYVNDNMGYEYEREADGKCINRKGSMTKAGSSCSKGYEPSPEAKKLM